MATIRSSNLQGLKDQLRPLLQSGYSPIVAYLSQSGEWVAVVQQGKCRPWVPLANEIEVWMGDLE